MVSKVGGTHNASVVRDESGWCVYVCGCVCVCVGGGGGRGRVKVERWGGKGVPQGITIGKETEWTGKMVWENGCGSER